MPFCFSENRNKKTKNPVTIFKCSQHSYATVRQNGVERTENNQLKYVNVYPFNRHTFTVELV